VRKLLAVCLSIALSGVLAACRERASSTVKHDACSLISKDEIGSVQEVSVNEIKSSERSEGVFRVSQCFYTAAEFSKSVNLALVEKDPNQRSQRRPKDFWKEKFGAYNTNEKERDEKSKTKAREQHEKGGPPKKISGLGDDAYWVSNRFGGVLYILKSDAFISIGLGGTDDEATKLEKSKVLARKALERL